MAKYLELVNGVPTVKNPATAGGASNALAIPQLDANGRLTGDMMPTGIGADTVQVTASEVLAAGDFVNVYNNSGAFAVRKADATSPAKFANGYVLAGVASGAVATIYTDDLNDQVTAQTPGDVYLSVTTPGKTQAAPPTVAGQIVQRLGFASSATTIKARIGQHYAL